MLLAEGGSRNRAGIRLPNGGGHVLLRLAEDTADGFQAEAYVWILESITNLLVLPRNQM